MRTPCSCAAFLGIGVLLAALSFPFLDSWLSTKAYTFRVPDLERIARSSLDSGLSLTTPSQRMEHVLKELVHAYPGLIATDTDWIFLHSGGWMGAFKLLYASLTEYVLLFGTAIPTDGHSGRYWANITDILLTGQFRQWIEGEVEPIVHLPGASVPHPAWSVSGVQWEGGSWMLEHATGLIPSTLGFAFSDGIFSTQDIWSLGKAVAVYARLVSKNLLAGRL